MNTQDAISSLKKLHAQFEKNARESYKLALQMGEILTVQKEAMTHGEWNPWVDEHLPFTVRSASTYMRLHREREYLESEGVSDLATADALLRAKGNGKSKTTYGPLAVEQWEILNGFAAENEEVLSLIERLCVHFKVPDASYMEAA